MRKFWKVFSDGPRFSHATCHSSVSSKDSVVLSCREGEAALLRTTKNQFAHAVWGPLPLPLPSVPSERLRIVILVPQRQYSQAAPCKHTCSSSHLNPQKGQVGKNHRQLLSNGGQETQPASQLPALGQHQRKPPSRGLPGVLVLFRYTSMESI